MQRGTIIAWLLVSVLASACTQAQAPVWCPESGAPLPARVHLRVDGEAQRRSLSCESRSAVDLMAFHGVRVDEDTFFQGLARSDNPALGFVGGVDEPGERLPPHGYGVYAGPVAERMTALGVRARAHEARDIDWLRREIAQGRPVIVWATGSLTAPRPVVMRDAAGRAFRAVRGEHTFLAVGYQPGIIRLLDPATGKEKCASIERFDASWAVLGRMALSVDQRSL